MIQDFQPASTHGSSAVKFAPDPQDTYVEPLWGFLGQGFIPMQVTSDPDATGESTSTNKLDPPIGLIVLPKNDYTSPFSIDLSDVPASVTAGLLPITPLISSSTNSVGPDGTQHAPGGRQPDHDADLLQERVISAYESFIGVDYQHHHNPFWLPTRRIDALECHRHALLPEPGSRLHQLHCRRLRRRARHSDVGRHHDAK